MTSELSLCRTEGSASTSASSISIDLSLEEPNPNEAGASTSTGITVPESQPGPGFKAKLFPQLIATLIACIGAWGLGSVLGWSSPAIPSLKTTNHLGTITDTDESWIGSASVGGAAISGILIGLLMERIGRKYTLFILQFPALVGWILIILSENVGMVIAGRFLTGFSGGAMTLVVPVYVSEIVEDKIRGALAAFMSLYIVSGLFFAYVLGAFMSWYGLSIACGIIPIIGLLVIFMPDSPTSLLARGKEQDAQNALIWLRGAKNFKQVEAEFKQIACSVTERQQISTKIKDILVPSVLKPISISMALFFFQEFGGITAVLFNAESIFESSGSNFSSSTSAVIIGAVQFACPFVTILVIDRIGRKPLLICAEIIVVICLISLGTFFYIKVQNDGISPEGFNWVPLVSLIGYIIAFSMGLNPLTGILLSELCPTHVKGIAGGFTNSLYWTFAFIVTRTFTDLTNILGDAGCYWLYAGISLIGVLFAIFIVPETKGMSLDQIDALFR